MRCQQCGQDNPEKHRFCGMCGTRLEKPMSTHSIDDNDPLDLEAPVYTLEDRSRLGGRKSNEFDDHEHQRDSARGSRISARGTNPSPAFVEKLPTDTAREKVVEEKSECKSGDRVAGIGGPSFLGLGYEGNNGFVYDSPRKDGFIYDSDGESPEYLLDDAPRRVSWRAWALVILLMAGAGLGYIQWRANHNEGPDIASILAGNGANLDPNHPVVTPGTPTPAAQKPAPNASSAEAAKDQKPTDSSAVQSASSDNADKPPAAASDSSNAKAANAKSETQDDEDASDDSSKNTDDATTPAKAAAESPRVGSEGPRSNQSKSDRAEPVETAEETPKPKPLGDKDPLLIEADKYLHGRGVRQNCSTGVNLVRQAISEGNPEADVKMGALYWSGTCVTHSNVTAYEWFSRAHSLEPKNRWIERSRSSLWANMTPQERQRISY
jgi:Double zinc ribbon